MYLTHHGILGQKWGVRNGPPYPLIKVKQKKNASVSNEIYKSLTNEEKKLVTARDEPPKEYTNQEELNTYNASSFVVSYKDIPVSVFDVWKENDNDVALALLTRNAPEFRNKGYATKAVSAGMKWLEKSGYENAYWDVRKDNAASIRLAEKNGFKKTDTFKDGEWLTYTKKLKR